ncbi:MAG: adenylyltransferase/cytidyltransferase family protein [Candidatus Pacebacteria bacterium]|nr:adenylyltransferase/cytidyltransferase family protein [Candidatus Paceibacterota bacterium]
MSKTNVDIKKKAINARIKIMVFGTFDGLHSGHVNFFKQAKSFMKNSFLIVSIARDKNVKRIKGKYPIKNEKERMFLVKKSGLADKVILAGKEKYLPHILREKVDIVALGYDQKAYVQELRKDLKDKGIPIKIVRLKPYKAKVYKNHLLKIRR